MNADEKKAANEAKKIIKQYRYRRRCNDAKMLNCLDSALAKLNQSDYTILFEKYININEPLDVEIIDKLSISESKFYRDLNKALLKFGEAYVGERKVK